MRMRDDRCNPLRSTSSASVVDNISQLLQVSFQGRSRTREALVHSGRPQRSWPPIERQLPWTEARAHKSLHRTHWSGGMSRLCTPVRCNHDWRDLTVDSAAKHVNPSSLCLSDNRMRRIINSWHVLGRNIHRSRREGDKKLCHDSMLPCDVSRTKGERDAGSSGRTFSVRQLSTREQTSVTNY